MLAKRLLPGIWNNRLHRRISRIITTGKMGQSPAWDLNKMIDISQTVHSRLKVLIRWSLKFFSVEIKLLLGVDMIWYDMVWYGMVWYDMIWYDIYGIEIYTASRRLGVLRHLALFRRSSWVKLVAWSKTYAKSLIYHERQMLKLPKILSNFICFDSDADVCWNIVSLDPTMSVSLSVKEIDVEYHGSCNYDYVDILDGKCLYSIKTLVPKASI